MRYILEKGSFKTTMYLFIGTGIFLIALFSYKIYIVLQERAFVSDFPGDWDNVIGIVLGIYLIIRSYRFRNRSIDLFIEITTQHLRYRASRKEKINVFKKEALDNITSYGGKVQINQKNTKQAVVIDLNSYRLTDTQKKQITDVLNQFL